MKPIRWDWDVLIHRHLEGSLTEEQRRVLNDGLVAEGRLRRRLAELAFEQAAWREAERYILARMRKGRLKRKRRWTREDLYGR